MPAAEHNAVLKLGRKRAEQLEDELARIVQQLLDDAADEAARNFEKYATDFMTAAGRSPLRPNRKAAKVPATWAAPSSSEILDTLGLADKVRTKTDPVRQAIIETVAGKALAKAGIEFDATNPFIGRALSKSGRHITHIADTTISDVQRAVSAAYYEGLSIPDTSKAIRTVMKEANPARARLIARTEMTGAVNGGSLAAAEIVTGATGDTLWKQWLTAGGAKYPRHEDYDGLDGQTVELDDSFDVGGDSLQYPGDPDGSPEEVCNCRCTMIYTDSSGQEIDEPEFDNPEG